MFNKIHLTLVIASLDGGMRPGRVGRKPGAKVGWLRANNVTSEPLSLAEVSGLAGVRPCIQAGAHTVDDDSGPHPPHPPMVAPDSPPSTGLAVKSSGTKDCSSSGRKTILIVDDEINIRESLAAVLQEENYAVRLAENGRAAVREFLNGSPDLILLDLNMPDTDGWTAFDVIARLAPDMPVIVITARPGQTRRAAEAGIDMLLEKPLDIPMLLQTIRALLASPEKSKFARILRAWRTNDVLGLQG